MSTPEGPLPSMLEWILMSEMEKTVWAATFAQAIHTSPNTDAASSADDAIVQLRDVDPTWRFARAEPEYEAARAGNHIDREPFDVWYRVAYGIRHANEPGYHPRTGQECADAYERFQFGRCDFR